MGHNAAECQRQQIKNNKRRGSVVRCPNCSAECSEQAHECEFCGHSFIEGVDSVEAQASPPPAPVPASNPNRATYTSSEPTYSIPEKSYTPPPPTPPENPYDASYPSASRTSRQSGVTGSVPNYLVWAILATLCCCLPAGIVAIVYAAQVDGKLAGGDYYGAVAASDNAKMWSWISFGASAVVGVLYFLLIMAGAIADPGRH